MNSDASTGTTTQQVGEPVSHRWRDGLLVRFFGLVALVGVAVGLLVDVRDGDYGAGFAFQVVLAVALVLGVCGVRSTVSADRAQIRPIQRWRRIRWADVDRVRRPGADGGAVQVVLKDDRTVSTGFPSSYAEQLAALGEVDLSS